jgi:putative flippase GtrA
VLAHRNGLKIIEQPIETIYIDGNKSSHFRPLQDSLRIYFVLFRFTLIAILSAAIDYAIFIALYYLVWNNIITCLVAGRLVSTVFNYVNVKRYAFHFKGTHSHSLPQYVMLACISLILSYAMISGLLSLFNMQVITAKLLSEFLMFIVNFLVQRDFIFRTREA